MDTRIMKNKCLQTNVMVTEKLAMMILALFCCDIWATET